MPSRTKRDGVILCLLLVLCINNFLLASSPLYKISTIAGGSIGDGLPGSLVSISNPQSIAFYPSSSLDDEGQSLFDLVFTEGNFIRKLSANYTSVLNEEEGERLEGTGILSTVAELESPMALAVSMLTGDIYVSEDVWIKKISRNGTVSNVFNAENQVSMVHAVEGLEEVLYLADRDFHTVRKLYLTNGTVETIAGSYGLRGYNGDNINATDALLDTPTGIALSLEEDTGVLLGIFIADMHNAIIRKISTTGIITTVAGIPNQQGYSVDGVLASAAPLLYPSAVTVSGEGELLIVERNFTNNALESIRKVGENGILTTLAGTGFPGFNGDDIPANFAQLNHVTAVLASPHTDSVYIVDSGNQRIRKVNQSGLISTIAGDGSSSFLGDGLPSEYSNLYLPFSVSAYKCPHNGTDMIYISDTLNHRVRLINNKGIISTVVGSTEAAPSDYIIEGTQANETKINTPKSVVYSAASGEVYFTSTRSSSSGVSTTIYKILQNKTIVAVAGCREGTNGTGDGDLAIHAHLSDVSAFVLAANGEMYIADSRNHRVRKVSTDGIISTIAGTGIAGYNGDDMNANLTQLNYPSSIVLTSSNELYIADGMNHRIRKISTEGIISTVVGTGETTFNGDGLIGNGTNLRYPYGISLSPNEDALYIADSGHSLIRKLSLSSGLVSIIAGVVEESGFNGDALIATTSQLNQPTSLSFSSDGLSIYISDILNNRVRKLTPYCPEGFTLEAANLTCEPLPIECFGLSQNDVNVCSGRGICSSFNNCTCISPYYGQQCENFNCFEINMNYTTVCSGVGQCISPNNCSCPEGYNGQECEQYECFGISHNSSDVCSGRGTCKGPNQCVCPSGYYGEQCADYGCFGVIFNNSEVCSGRGVCSSSNNCTCNSPYYGQKCENFNCFEINMNSETVCSGVGQCISPNNCSCPEGYNGQECGHYECFGISHNSSDVCSGRGTCKGPNQCVCSTGYYGEQCTDYGCFGVVFNNSEVCQGRGECIGPNNCSCSGGYFGRNCTSFNCFGVKNDQDNVCSSNGICIAPNQCQCNNPWGGSDCSVFNFCEGNSSSLFCSIEKDEKLKNFTETTVEFIDELDEFDSMVFTFTKYSNVRVTLPSSMSQYLMRQLGVQDDEAPVNFVRSASDISQLNSTFGQQTVVSPVVTIMFFNQANGQKIDIQNLAQPIQLAFTVKAPSAQTRYTQNYLTNIACAYYDSMTQSWKSDGVTTATTVKPPNYDPSYYVVCKTSHLMSSFALIANVNNGSQPVPYPSKPKASSSKPTPVQSSPKPTPVQSSDDDNDIIDMDDSTMAAIVFTVIIAGIVVIMAVAGGVGYYLYKKKQQRPSAEGATGQESYATLEENDEF